MAPGVDHHVRGHGLLLVTFFILLYTFSSVRPYEARLPQEHPLHAGLFKSRPTTC